MYLSIFVYVKDRRVHTCAWGGHVRV